MIRTLTIQTADRLVHLRAHVEASFYLQVALLFGLYVVSHDRWFIGVHEQTFSEPGIVLAVLGYSRVLLAGLILTVVAAALTRLKVNSNIFYGRLGWGAFKAERDLDIKYFIVAVELIIAWAFSNYEFNFLYNQPHVLDRVLIIILALLILVHPYFLPLFTLVAFVIFSQFLHAGIGPYTQLDKQPVFDLLILASVFVILRLFVRIKTVPFVFLALCLLASFYFVPGLGKLQIGPLPWSWLLENKLHNLFVSSYVNGWLGFADQATILSLANVLQPLDVPFQAFTLIIEVGMLFIVVRKRLSIALLLGAMGLHIGILAASGIFFWKWLLVDAAFLLLLWQNRAEPALHQMFNPRYGLLSMVLILFSPYFFRPATLAWFDTPLNNVYHLEVVDSEGSTHRVDAGYIAPYDVIFAQNRFYYLSETDVLTYTYGSTSDYNLAQALEDAGTDEVISELKRTFGSNWYIAQDAQNFDRFIQSYFHNLNAGISTQGRQVLPLLPLAPHHIHSFPAGDLGLIRFPIREVRVRFQEVYYDGEALRILQDRLIREILIP